MIRYIFYVFLMVIGMALTACTELDEVDGMSPQLEDAINQEQENIEHQEEAMRLEQLALPPPRTIEPNAKNNFWRNNDVNAQ